MKIGTLLYQKRKSTNHSLSRASELIGVKKDTLCNWERGTSKPSSGYVKRILEVYDLTLDEFLEAYRESLVGSVDKSVDKMRSRLV